MDPPRPGKIADEVMMKKQYRTLSIKYHPDLNPNHPEGKQLQIAINQAYEKLTQYNESLKENN
jgi:DnaJ-class molecular chaperone